MQMPNRATLTLHELPRLPYSTAALAPFMSRETLEYHHGKHHRGYVSRLNQLVVGTEFERADLRDIIRKSTGPIFNNAAQAWNHNFLWKSLSPGGGGEPPHELARALEHGFGSVNAFKQLFSVAATEKFGSGWVWLVKTRDGRLEISCTDDADTPLRSGNRALLACDVWEHAYYLDYRDDRGRYLDAYWNIVNWKFAAENLAARVP